MNTVTVKEIGKTLMVVGGCTFIGGVGIYSTASLIDMFDYKSEHKKLILDEELKALEEHNDAVLASEHADAAKALAIKEQVEKMNPKEFAKWKAEADAKASEDAIAKAREIANDANSKIAKATLECNEKITKMETECSRKVDESFNKYINLKKKYDSLKELFDDKDKILEAKEKLAKFNQKKADDNQAVKELSEAISKLVNK